MRFNNIISNEIIGIEHQINEGRTDEAIQSLLMLWSNHQSQKKILTYCVYRLKEIGARIKAIELLQKALSYYDVTEDLCLLIGSLATDLEMPEIAEKIYIQAIHMNKNEPAHYVNLLEALRKQDRYEEAILISTDLLVSFPNYAKLWAIHARLLSEDGRKFKDIRDSYQKAMEHGSDDYDILVAYANLFALKYNQVSYYKKAIKINHKKPEAHVGLGLHYLCNGEFKKGWSHYAYRLMHTDGVQPQIHYSIQAKNWSGESLNGKTIMILPEQGIGDEVLFAINIPRVLELCDKVYIGCEPRLIDIYKRSFSGAVIAGFEDEIIEGRRHRKFPSLDNEEIAIDFSIPLVSLCQLFWHSKDTLPTTQGYLVPDPVRVNAYKKKYFNHDKMKIGISWESGKLSEGRKNYYHALDDMLSLISLSDVEIYNLQYSADEKLIQNFNEIHGVNIITFPTIDLKQDIEANLAIMANLDLVTGPSIATQMFALASGCQTCLMTWGLPWWFFGDQSTITQLFPKGSVLERKVKENWKNILDNYVEQNMLIKG